jgi:hypothetical protein
MWSHAGINFFHLIVKKLYIHEEAQDSLKVMSEEESHVDSIVCVKKFMSNFALGK